MKLFTHLPAEVGIVPWGGSARFSFFAKFAFELSNSQFIAVAAPAGVGGIPYGTDRAALSQGGEVYYPSDFTPLKDWVDILFVGHVRAASAVPEKVIELRVGDSTRWLKLVAGTPSFAFPLRAGHLREANNEPTTTGPTVGPGYATITDPSYAQAWSQPAFQYDQFQVAPERQRVRTLPDLFEMELRGFFEETPHIHCKVPVEAPQLVLLKQRGEAAQPVPLGIDTVWFDLDKRLLVVVYRGITMLTHDRLSTYTATLSPKGEPEDRLWRMMAEIPAKEVCVWSPRAASALGPESKLVDQDAQGPESVRGPSGAPQMPEPKGFDPKKLPWLAYAALSARLAFQPAERDKILDREGLLDIEFDAAEDYYAAVLKIAVARGPAETVEAFDNAYNAELAKLRGPIDPPTYAELSVAIENGNQRIVAQRLRIPVRAFTPIRRQWARWTKKNPALAEQLKLLMAEQRKRG